MIIYILIAIAAVLFLGGMWFLTKGIQGTQDALKAVPISNFKEIRDLQKKDVLIHPSAIQASLSKHLVDENKNPSAFEADKLSLKDLQIRIEQLKSENLRLTTALKREVDSKDTSTLSAIEREKFNEKDDRLRLSDERIEKLSSDYNQLKKLWEEKNADYENLQAQFNEKMTEYAQMAGHQADSSKELYDEIHKLRDENKVLGQKAQALAADIQQNQKLQEIAYEQKQLVMAFEKQIADLKNSNSVWQLKLDEEIGKWRKENDGLFRCLKEEEEKSKELTAAFTSLSRKYEEAVNVHSRASDDQVSLLGEQLSKLLTERDEYKQKAEVWEKELERFRELNKHLGEKEKILQYELTKSRAQALGLERICEDLKILANNTPTLNK